MALRSTCRTEGGSLSAGTGHMQEERISGWHKIYYNIFRSRSKGREGGGSR